VGPRASLDGFEKEKISSASQHSNPRTIQAVASHYTNYTILTLLHEGLHKFIYWVFKMETVFSVRYRLRPSDNVNVSPFVSKVEDVGYVGLYKISKGNSLSSHS
jgi:hypothetical protein